MKHLLKINNIVLNGILSETYKCIEKIPIILGSKTMSNGSKRFNFATIQNVNISVKIGRLNSTEMKDLLNLLKSNFVFSMEYWSVDDKVFKTRNFKLVDIPEPLLLTTSYNEEKYDELDIEFETVG